MAQKKVILKDGADELLPKTSASMVFTESGQTVEAALQNAGTGGGGTGGGIDEEQLAQYLQQHEYVTQTALDEAHYLKPTSGITGYAKASNYTALVPTDTLNEALGKLEAGIGSGGAGDDVYYLPVEVYQLDSGCTEEDFLEAFGGEDGISELKNAMENGKRIYIRSKEIYNNILIPVSYTYVLLTSRLAFLSPNAIGGILVNILLNSKEVHTISLKGYSLKDELLTLTADSNTDSISSAVSGESGLKAIIQAVENGNRLYSINLLTNTHQYLLASKCSVEDNGDMMLSISGIGPNLWGGYGGILTINYTKSSNTFSCAVIPISMGS